MKAHRKRLVLALVGTMVCAQSLAILTRREWWPFSPIAMYSGTLGELYSARVFVVTEPDGSRHVLENDQRFGDYTRPFVMRFAFANSGKREALAWAAERYADQRRREGKALPRKFSIARVTWKMVPGGNRRSKWKRMKTLASHTY